MILLRRKIFMAREDNWNPIPESERFDSNHPLVIKHGGKMKVVMRPPSKEYANPPIGPERIGVQRPRVEELKRSIRGGFLYTDRVEGESTHPFNKKCTSNMHTLTKDINGYDRLGYEVYSPIETDVNPEIPVEIPVRLISRSGHLK